MPNQPATVIGVRLALRSIHRAPHQKWQSSAQSLPPRRRLQESRRWRLEPARTQSHLQPLAQPTATMLVVHHSVAPVAHSVAAIDSSPATPSSWLPRPLSQELGRGYAHPRRTPQKVTSPPLPLRRTTTQSTTAHDRQVYPSLHAAARGLNLAGSANECIQMIKELAKDDGEIARSLPPVASPCTVIKGCGFCSMEFCSPLRSLPQRNTSG